jgi:peptidoglycan hydrolase CwlO-like protein
MRVKKQTIILIALLLFVPLTPVWAVTQEDVQKTQQELSQTNSKLSEINSNISELQSQIATNNALLPQKQAENDALMQQVSNRTRAMYMTGTNSYLSYLFSAKDLGEFISYAQNVSSIVASDTKLLKEAQAAQQSLEDSNRTIQESAEQLQSEMAQAQSLKNEQSSTLTSQQSQLATQAQSGGSYSGSSAISDIAGSNSPKVTKAVQIMENLCSDSSHGYSQSNRWGPDFDCSSSVIYSLQEAGFDTAGANSSHDISALTGCGWAKVGTSELSAGDILVNEQCHLAMYVGGGQVAEFVSDYDGSSGDSGGNESYVHAYYSFPWDYALRYTGD